MTIPAQKVEELSALIHKVYCQYYLKRYGHDYWTLGDYSKLDKATKDADRYMARFCMRMIIESNLAQLRILKNIPGRDLYIVDTIPELEEQLQSLNPPGEI